ncbi:Odorant receptor 83a [Anthophora retusa]
MKKEQRTKDTSVTTEHDYNKYLNLSIELNRWLLKPFGIWPSAHKPTGTGKYFIWLINLLCYSLMGFEFISCGMYVILEVEGAYGHLKLMGPITFFAISFLKYYLLTFHEDDILECIEQIKWDWKNVKCIDDRNVMVTYAYYGRRLIIICTFFLCSSFVFFYVITPINAGIIVTIDGNHSCLRMPFPFPKTIADADYSPFNEIFFTVQFVTGIVMHGVTSATCSLAALFAIHGCGQMEVLKSWLQHLVDGRADMSETVDGRIASIVSQHVRILNFLALTEKTMQQIAFVEFLGCTVILCLIEYYIITEWDPNELTPAMTHTALFLSFTFNIFIFCYIGEIVAEHCRKVGEMSYMIEWYRLIGNKKLCCVLIIAMSNSSVKLTAGNMVDLSIDTFSEVVKTSMAFLNVLRATT